MGRNFNAAAYRIRERVFRRVVNSLEINPHNCEVLDVGSGTGFYLGIWKDYRVKSLTGSDLAERALKIIRDKYPDVRQIQLDIGDRQAPIEKNSYDLISAMDVLYHIVDDERYAQAFKNAYQMLRRDGHLIFSENFLHRSALAGQHCVSRTKADIEKIVQASGLRIVKRVPLLVIMDNPAESRNPLLKLHWRLVTSVVWRSELIGGIWGFILSCLDGVLTGVLKESPSLELMVCRKVN